jgi:hypothetical protein
VLPGASHMDMQSMALLDAAARTSQGAPTVMQHGVYRSADGDTTRRVGELQQPNMPSICHSLFQAVDEHDNLTLCQ